jgi:hypothetical protein
LKDIPGRAALPPPAILSERSGGICMPSNGLL